MQDFARGLLSVIKVTVTPLLYRHPYRTSAEAMRSDWLSIGKDIDSVIGRLKTAAHDERRDDE
jgi:hypothetical protein